MRRFLRCILKLILVETSVSMAKPHSEEARVQALGEDRSVAGSERGDSSPISEVA